MKKQSSGITLILDSLVIFFMANIILFSSIGRSRIWIPIVMIAFIIINIKPDITNDKLHSKRLRCCANGIALLKAFLLSTIATVCFLLIITLKHKSSWLYDVSVEEWVLGIILEIIVEAFVFWNGIIRVYVTAKQLGIKWRAIGVICGWIPIAHLYALGKIIQIASKEVIFEESRIIRNIKRSDEQVCATKYPILLVHGVFFRDFRYLNYWGRIPEELEKNGAKIFYGNHQSAASVADSGQEIADRILEIVKLTGCQKVNLIAHSKGGLDCRMALSIDGVAEHVASLITINTPHRGCEFADYLLGKIPQKEQRRVAAAYNAALRKLGDTAPDFLAAVNDLTAKRCTTFNESISDVEGIYYKSVGSRQNKSSSGRFPLNFSYLLVNAFEDENDGLVGRQSFKWTDNYEYLTIEGKRGISHGDVIDLNREDIPEFDVREFYVNLVSELKNKRL